MDNRLYRSGTTEDKEAIDRWLKGNKQYLDLFVSVLHSAVEDISRDDNLSTFTEANNPLVVLAHRAGRREGLREAIRLLTTR